MTVDTGGMSLDGGLSISNGGLFLTGSLTVVDGSLYVSDGALSIADGIRVTGGMTLHNGGLWVTDGITVHNGNLNITGDAHVHGLMDLDGGFTVKDGLTINAGGLNVAGGMTVLGNVYMQYYHTISDRRFKRNIVSISNPLEKVNRLRGVYFNWNEAAMRALHGIEDVKSTTSQDSAENNNDRQLGVIAQEVKSVIPEVVRTQQLPKQKRDKKLKSLRTSREEDGIQTKADTSTASSSSSSFFESDSDSDSDDTFLQVDYGAIVPLLIEAVRELDSRVGMAEVAQGMKAAFETRTRSNDDSNNDSNSDSDSNRNSFTDSNNFDINNDNSKSNNDSNIHNNRSSNESTTDDSSIDNLWSLAETLRHSNRQMRARNVELHSRLDDLERILAINGL